jgi:hypothetical protein|tara:strand:- start:199 stop:375 length:177 start_codon:yes stop_codon:yes gene_type:complete
MMKYYIEAIFTEEPFVLAWEVFVFFMLLMFISIIWRLHRIENKVDEWGNFILEELEDR